MKEPLQDLQRLQREKQREQAWSDRSRRFWRTFLFTENGRPKSALMIYTFCLSFVFAAVNALVLSLMIDWLTPALAALAPGLVNAAISLATAAVAVGAGALLHRFMKDKRLVFGTYIWLGIYVLAVLAAEWFFLHEVPGAYAAFFSFFLWAAVVPVAAGLLTFCLLYRRTLRPR